MRKLLFALIALSVAACTDPATTHDKPKEQKPATDTIPKKSASVQTPAPPAVRDTLDMSDPSKDKPGLPVTVLPTDDASAGDPDDSESPPAFKYPPRLTMDETDVAALSQSIGAYGAAHMLWLGPKGWTGKGGIYTNGGITADLFPQGSDDLKGAHVHYSIESSCAGCIIQQAAPYFKEAREQYDIDYNSDNTNPIKLPDGIKIKKVSATVVRYTLPEANGLMTTGVMFYGSDSGDDDEKYVTEAIFVLPAEQRALMDDLVKWYIKKAAAYTSATK